MSDRPEVHPRIQRRETHAARSMPAIVIAVVLILALDRDAIDAALRDRLQQWELTPTLRSRVRIEKAGEVGA